MVRYVHHFVVAMLVLVASARADTVETHDGTVYTGKVIMQGPRAVVITPDGKQTVIQARDIARVQIGAPKAPAAPAQTQPVEQTAGSLAEQALRYFQSGPVHYGDATNAANAALKMDERNVLALTVLGLMPYLQGDAAAARDEFLKVVAIDPKNVMALNNLGVIAALPKESFGQKPITFYLTQRIAQKAGDQESQADVVKYYTAAIQAGPDNIQVLDNVAYELDVYMPKTDLEYVKLHDLWMQAEKVAEPVMATKNLFRWGSGWVTGQALYGLNNQLEDAQNKLTLLQQQHTMHSDALAGDKAQLNELQQQINALPAGDNRDARRISSEEDRVDSVGDSNAVLTDELNMQTVQQQVDDIHAKAFVPPRMPIIAPAQLRPAFFPPPHGRPMKMKMLPGGVLVPVGPATEPGR